MSGGCIANIIIFTELFKKIKSEWRFLRRSVYSVMFKQKSLAKRNN